MQQEKSAAWRKNTRFVFCCWCCYCYCCCLRVLVSFSLCVFVFFLCVCLFCSALLSPFSVESLNTRVFFFFDPRSIGSSFFFFCNFRRVFCKVLVTCMEWLLLLLLLLLFRGATPQQNGVSCYVKEAHPPLSSFLMLLNWPGCDFAPQANAVFFRCVCVCVCVGLVGRCRGFDSTRTRTMR